MIEISSSPNTPSYKWAEPSLSSAYGWPSSVWTLGPWVILGGLFIVWYYPFLLFSAYYLGRYLFGAGDAHPLLGPIVTGGTVVILTIAKLFLEDDSSLPSGISALITVSGCLTTLALCAWEFRTIQTTNLQRSRRFAEEERARRPNVSAADPEVTLQQLPTPGTPTPRTHTAPSIPRFLFESLLLLISIGCGVMAILGVAVLVTNGAIVGEVGTGIDDWVAILVYAALMGLFGWWKVRSRKARRISNRRHSRL
jgi:hypothetical protein